MASKASNVTFPNSLSRLWNVGATSPVCTSSVITVLSMYFSYALYIPDFTPCTVVSRLKVIQGSLTNKKPDKTPT